METCLLCLELTNNSVERINVNSTKWQEFSIKNLIEKHLWSMQTEHLSSWLCTTCWKELHDFHQFYIRIENAHMNFTTLVKIKHSPHEEDQYEQVSFHELPPLIIKEEPDSNIWEDSNSFMQTTTEVLQEMSNNPDDETIVNIRLNTTKELQKSKITKTNKNKNANSLKSTNTTSEILKKEFQEQTKIQHKSVAIEEMKKEVYDNDDSDTDPHNDEINKTSANNKSMERDNFLAENFQIVCIICQTPLSTFMALREHFKNEHEQSGYVVCCNKQFFKRNVLLEHVNQHLDPNYLRCKSCDKLFSTRRVLKIHMSLHDPKREKKFCCEVCGRKFSTPHVLNTHKTRHLSEEEKLFPCPECGKNYGNHWTLKSHLRSVHRPKMNCDICGLFLVNKSALTLHKRIKHVEGKPIEYSCSICSRISPSRPSLLEHIKNAHQRNYDYKCTMCDKAFKRPRSLKEHMATHTNTALYSCPWCTKTFKSHSNITKHHKTWHPKEYQQERLKKYAGNSPPKYKKNIENS